MPPYTPWNSLRLFKNQDNCEFFTSTKKKMKEEGLDVTDVEIHSFIELTQERKYFEKLERLYGRGLFIGDY